MKNKIVVVLIVLCLFATGCSARGEGGTDQSQEQNGSEVKAEAAKLVETETIELETIAEEVETIGKVNAETLISIGADRSGTVDKINVSVGDRVSVGDILYTVDKGSLVNDINSQSVTSRNNLSSAELSYDNALETYEENQKLYDSGIISKSELDSSYDNMELQKLSYNNALSNYNSTITSSEYSIDDTVLEATIDGVISAINIELGQKSGFNDIEIMGEDEFLINTVVSNRIIDDLSLGDKVRIIYDGDENEGIISEIGEMGIDGTDSFDVGISINKSDCELKVGYRVDIVFNVFKEDNQLVVPKKSILTDENGDYVFVKNEGLAEKVYVTQGYINSGYVQVFGDLEAGDELIVKGQNYVSEGSMLLLEGEDNEKNS